MKIGEMKICLLIPQFGKLPSNIDLWLKSCEYNNKINFLVMSDIKKENIPDNVTWIYISFEDFKNLVKEKIPLDICFDEPYECCEFRAAYSLIFEEYLNGFEYWGYCDMDLIFGDLEYFFKKYEYQKYDKFLSQGHLTLYRNTEENNNRYKLPATPGKDYISAMTKKGTSHFDEDEINIIYKVYGFPFFESKELHMDVSREFKRIRLGGKHPDYKLQAFYWQRGKVFRAYHHHNVINTQRRIDFDEYLYIHFSRRKMAVPDFDVNNVVGFYICPDCFKEKKHLGPPTKQELKIYNPYKGKLYEKYEWFKFALERLRVKCRF